ncbi:MAG: hypothetical protein Q9Q13_12250 [Acidobacteriota bacterium]|nr:hypothetical protein [Acidobacteriota bacterium]
MLDAPALLAQDFPPAALPGTQLVESGAGPALLGGQASQRGGDFTRAFPGAAFEQFVDPAPEAHRLALETAPFVPGGFEFCPQSLDFFQAMGETLFECGGALEGLFQARFELADAGLQLAPLLLEFPDFAPGGGHLGDPLGAGSGILLQHLGSHQFRGGSDLGGGQGRRAGAGQVVQHGGRLGAGSPEDACHGFVEFGFGPAFRTGRTGGRPRVEPLEQPSGHGGVFRGQVGDPLGSVFVGRRGGGFSAQGFEVGLLEQGRDDQAQALGAEPFEVGVPADLHCSSPARNAAASWQPAKTGR